MIRYLTDSGWARQTSRDGKLIRLSLDGREASETVNLIFSTTARDADERTEVAAALDTLEQLYETPRFEIVQSISSLAYDLILTRIPDEYVRHESIELGTAQAYMHNMRRLIAASANTEISGELSFRRTLKEALNYANECRFGHTFQGSFGFVIESPVGLNESPQMPIVEAVVPLGRKVVRRMARGLESFQAAIAEDNPEPIVSAEGGMSANMCDEVIGIVEDTGISKLELSIAFSPEWGPEPNATTRPFAIERRYVDLLKDASSRLRKEETPREESIIGRIVRLETDGNPSDLLNDKSGREVIVSWDSADYGHIRVQVPLDPSSYLTAVDAHAKGHLFGVSGLLKRNGRSWVLERATTPRLIS